LKEANLPREWSKTINKRTLQRVKYWEIIADNLSKAGWSLGSAIECEVTLLKKHQSSSLDAPAQRSREDG
jgi:hypothetical protein